jgi:hypothetical protein
MTRKEECLHTFEGAHTVRKQVCVCVKSVLATLNMEFKLMVHHVHPSFSIKIQN